MEMNTLKKFIAILGFYTAGQLKNSQMMREQNQFWSAAVDLLWIWMFGAVTKVRTMKENYSLGRPVMSYTDAWIAVVNGRIACICS